MKNLKKSKKIFTMYPIQPQMQIQISVEIYNTNKTSSTNFNFEILSNVPIINKLSQVLIIGSIPLSSFLDMIGISLNVQTMMQQASSSDHSFLYTNGVYLFYIVCEEKDPDRNTHQQKFYGLTCKIISLSTISKNFNWNKRTSFKFSEVYLEYHIKQACSQNENIGTQRSFQNENENYDNQCK